MNKMMAFMLVLLIPALAFAADMKRYEYESGSFTMETKSPMGNSTTIHYFDDYGQKNRTQVNSKVNAQNGIGLTTNMVIIMNGEKTYTLFPESKTYMSDFGDMDEDDSDDDMALPTADHMKDAKPIRTEDVMGKSCKVYQEKDDDGTMTMWMWKGFVLKQKIEPKGNPQLITISKVTKLDLGGSVDSDMFELPADYKENKLGFGELFKNMDRAMAEQEKEAAEEQRRADREEAKVRAEEREMEEESVEEEEIDDDEDDVEKAIDIMKSFF